MRVFRGLSLALVLTGSLVPLTASAQKETRETKDAQKQLGLALIRQTEAEKAPFYEQALTILQPAFTSDAENALVWKLAGEAHAGLGHMVEADEAFDKAEQLNPEYAEEIAGLRETGWIVGFQRGVDQMDSGQNDEALATLLAANTLYDKRPEAYLNIASLHAQKLEIEPAIEALELAVERSQGELYEQLDSAGQAQWRDLRRMAESNIGQLQGAAGVEAFQNQDFTAAQTWFERAHETNPHARDYVFNIVQAKWAQTQKLEQQIEDAPESAAQAQPQLSQLYQDIKGQIPTIQQIDPNNEQLVMMLAQTEKRLHEMSGDSAGANPAAYQILQTLETMPVALDEIAVEANEGTAQISGVLKNLNVEGGATVTINLTLIGQDGSQVGTAQVRVVAPAKTEEETSPVTPFEGSTTVIGPVAGWRYTVSAG